VSTQRRLTTRHATAPGFSVAAMALSPRVWPSHPMPHGPVHLPARRVQRRLINATVVVHPATQDWIDHPGPVFQRLIRLSRHAPVVTHLAPGLRRIVADPWRAADQECTVAVLGPSGTPRVPQHVKPCCWVFPPAVIILTVNNPSSVRRTGRATRRGTRLASHLMSESLSYHLCHPLG
jgi:hypothetical protein